MRQRGKKKKKKRKLSTNQTIFFGRLNLHTPDVLNSGALHAITF